MAFNAGNRVDGNPAQTVRDGFGGSGFKGGAHGQS